MDAVSTYFEAERAESLLFIAVALAALAVSLWGLRVRRTRFFQGLAVTLSVIAAIQLVVGVTIFLRSPQDTVRVQRMLREAPAQLQTEEVPRMRAVVHNFAVYLKVELVLGALGIVGLLWAAPGGRLRGAAAGLAMQAAFTAVLDLFATRRAEVYLAWLLAQA